MPRIVDQWFLPRRSDNTVTCVQTKFTEDAVYVRNNLRPDAGTAVFDHAEWAVFVASVKDGDYDLEDSQQRAGMTQPAVADPPR